MGFYPGFLGLSVLELGRGTRQTDRQTDTAHHFIMEVGASTFTSLRKRRNYFQM